MEVDGPKKKQQKTREKVEEKEVGRLEWTPMLLTTTDNLVL